MRDPDRFRNYAKQCRELAKVAPDERYRQALIEMAEDFEEEAESLQGDPLAGGDNQEEPQTGRSPDPC